MNAFRKKLCLLAILFFALFASARSQKTLPPTDDVRFDGQFIYVVAENLYKVIKIDTTGNIVGEIGNRGKGPGEFSSDNIEIELFDNKLHVLDKLGYKIIIIDKSSFLLIEEKIIQGNPIDLFHHQNDLMGLRIRQFPLESESNGADQKEYTAEKIFENGSKYFFKFKNKSLNPFYNQKKVLSSGDKILVYYPYQNIFNFYNANSLKKQSLPLVEAAAFGKEIERDLPNGTIQELFAYKFTPEVKLVRSVIFNADSNFVFHLKSYKRGNSLIEFNIDENTFNSIGVSHHNKIVGMDSEKLYSIDDNKLKHVSVSDVKACSKDTVKIYIDSFKEQCYTCKESLFELYDMAKANNIPIEIVLENPNWFSAPDEENYHTAANFLKQWDIWGGITFVENCDGCFDAPISISFESAASTNKIFPLPIKKDVFYEELACI